MDNHKSFREIRDIMQMVMDEHIDRIMSEEVCTVNEYTEVVIYKIKIKNTIS